MRIDSVRVRNFRCIRDEMLRCDKLTVLVGKNGSGKSSFLKALQMFYTPAASYTLEDFYNQDISKPIIITVSFTDLAKEESDLFRPYIHDDTLAVEKELTWPYGKGSQRYFGSRLQRPAFSSIRSADKVLEKRRLYSELAESAKAPDLAKLPGNVGQAVIEETLTQWEAAHPESLEYVRDEGQFFGFKEVGQARLERFTAFLLIPAVRDAALDATEGRNSAISQIMDLVVRSTLAQCEDLRQFKEEAARRYGEIMDPNELLELNALAREMSATIEIFAPGTRIELSWQPAEAIDIPMPKAEVKVVEDGYPTAVERAGHGVQRAFLLAALQHLEVTQRSKAAAQTLGDQEGASGSHQTALILAIEEPELYQHPSRQRHLSQVLLKLTEGRIPGVAQQTQVIYSTHSPLFVDIQRFDQLRLLRKCVAQDNLPKHTEVFQTTMNDVTRRIERADGAGEGSRSPEAERAHLRTLMTPWTNEGFFSDSIVLVEGEGDRAAIMGVAKTMGYQLDSMDIAVIPCMGKTNLEKAFAIFDSLEIPSYVVWDGDFGCNTADPKNNRRLLRCLGLTEPEMEDWPSAVMSSYACLKTNLETVVRDEIGPGVYDDLLRDCRQQFGYAKVRQAKKSPDVMEAIINRARELGHRSKHLEDIVGSIVANRRSS